MTGKVVPFRTRQKPAVVGGVMRILCASCDGDVFMVECAQPGDTRGWMVCNNCHVRMRMEWWLPDLPPDAA